MELLSKSDEEVKGFASKVLAQLIEASNDKNWEKFSSFFVTDDRSIEDAQKDVENQWDTNPVITTFTQSFDFLGVLRKSDHIVTLWKMRSESVPDDILGFLAFKQVGDEAKVYGFRI
ncbi:hypothetical protein EYS14_10575 [Alteromonadaceae bacterium M269]|nr:hypothetical protein EYS14_10575 [Alteromonadaceae bacterium M269]